MICKWCGATTTGNRCRRCGKEQPALSQCGGFYNLVPGAAPPAAQAKNSPLAAILAVLCVVLAIAVVILFVVQIRLQAKNNRLERELEYWENHSFNGSEDTTPDDTAPIDATESEPTADPTEATTGNEELTPSEPDPDEVPSGGGNQSLPANKPNSTDEADTPEPPLVTEPQEENETPPVIPEDTTPEETPTTPESSADAPQDDQQIDGE